MKKIALALVLAMSCLQMFSQDKPSFYTSVGVSLSNGEDFAKVCYPSIENGIMYKNFFGSIVLGRGNFYGMGSETDNIENYFYEAKLGLCVPIVNSFSGVVFGGYGGYFKPYNFIEYGCGISYTINKVSFSLCYSNWDNVNYLTPSISYTW